MRFAGRRPETVCHNRSFFLQFRILRVWAVFITTRPLGEFPMKRRILALALLLGCVVVAQPAKAQGLWLGGPGFGGIGFGSPGFNGLGFSPYGFGNFGLYGGGFGSGFSPYGFGNAAYFGGYAPTRVAYPVAVRPVYVARPVVYGGISRAYPPRPAVRVPLNRANRRAWRRGW